jgi:hypothetical protein
LKIKIYTSFPFSDFISKPVENEGQDFWISSQDSIF